MNHVTQESLDNWFEETPNLRLHFLPQTIFLHGLVFNGPVIIGAQCMIMAAHFNADVTFGPQCMLLDCTFKNGIKIEYGPNCMILP